MGLYKTVGLTSIAVIYCTTCYIKGVSPFFLFQESTMDDEDIERDTSTDLKKKLKDIDIDKLSDKEVIELYKLMKNNK
jgi:hypothetical protein